MKGDLFMQPFVNPNFFNYSQYQQPNPYLQRMENLQQFQQTIQPTNQIPAIGKLVESIDIVKVTDIPMDGNAYYFPKADGTEIYSKQFMADGRTRILTFKPVLDEEPSVLPQANNNEQFEVFNAMLSGIQEDVKALYEKVDKIGKPARGKKEVSDDES